MIFTLVGNGKTVSLLVGNSHQTNSFLRMKFFISVILFNVVVLSVFGQQPESLFKNLNSSITEDFEPTPLTFELVKKYPNESRILADSIMKTQPGKSLDENLKKFQIAASVFKTFNLWEKQSKALVSMARSYIDITGFYSTYSESNILIAEEYLKKAIIIGRREKLYDQLGSTYGIKSYIYSTNLLNNDGSYSEDYFTCLDSSIYFFEKAGNRPSSGLASAYSSYANALRFAGELEPSLPYFYKSINEFEQIEEAKSLPYVYSSFAATYKTLNNLDSSLYYIDLALKLATERFLIAEQFEFGISKAQTLNLYGELELALIELDRLIEIAEGLYNNPQAREFSIYQQGRIKVQKGFLYFLNESFSQARTFYLAASKDLEKLEKPSYELGEAYHAISQIEINHFNFDSAIYFADKYIQNSIPDTLILVNAYIHKAQVYQNMGDQKNSLENIGIASDLYDKIYRIPGFMSSMEVQGQLQALVAIGSYYYQIKDYEKSIDYFEKCIQLCYENDLASFQAHNYFNVAAAYYDLKDYEKSISYLTKWLKLSKKYETDQELYPIGVLLIVGAYQNMGNPTKALQMMESANLVDLLENGELPIDRLMLTLVDAAIVGLNDRNSAIDKLEEAAVIIESMNITQATKYPYYSYLGDQYKSIGAIDKAIEYYKMAINLIYEVLDVSGSVEVQDRYLSLSYDVVQKIIPLLIEQEKNDEVFDLIENAKSRSLRKMLAIRPGQELQVEITDIRETQDSLYSLLRNNQLTPEMHDKVNIQIERNNNIIESYTFNNLPEFDSTIDLESTKQLLGPGEVVVQYVLAQEFVYAFLIQSDNVEIFNLNTSKSEIEEMVLSLLEPFYEFKGSGTLPEFDYQLSFNLYEKLIKEIKTSIKSTNQKLIIIPDGILFNLPFDLLINNHPSKEYSSKDFLISEYDISYIPSATVLARLRSKSKSYKYDFLALAPFSKTGKRRWRHLPFSDKYLSVYAGYFNSGRTAIILDNNATTDYFSKLVDFKICHFSTHAQTSDDHPHTSSIGLYNDDFYTHQLFGLQLNTDLIILDACETGLGSIANGEGVIGFSRGFFAAGTSSLILSKWKVGYQPTRELFGYFYANQVRGDHYSEALRKAKLRMIDTFKYKDDAGNIIQGIDHTNPFIWASLVYLGY